MYGLTEEYQTNPVFRMQHASRDASMWQVGVYFYVRQLMMISKLRNILDIGCGFPEKLEKYILPVTKDIVGLDLPEIVEMFKDRFSFGRWIPFYIESSETTIDKKFDVILSSDVIEHLENPDTLLNLIKRQCHKDTFIVLSTPDRDTLGAGRLGPPKNAYHVREWNKKEFVGYVKSRGFNIIQSFLADEPAAYKCHVCVCKISDPSLHSNSAVFKDLPGQGINH